MARQFGWGIIGPGRIATLTTRGPLAHLPNVRRVAVGSRSKERAAEFAERFGFERSYGSYEELVLDPDVEIAYVATPHPFHKQHTLLCLEHGKHVLCEKPMGMNAREVQAMIDCAKANQRYLVEGIFSYFVPMLRQVKSWIGEALIGDVRMIWASNGFIAGPNVEDRILKKALGGGGLLDMGVYTVSLPHQILGAPSKILAAGYLGATGADETEAMIFEYPGNRYAILATSISTRVPSEAVIQGTAGKIVMHPNWHGNPRKATLYAGNPPKVEEVPFEEADRDHLYEAEYRDHEKSWMVAAIMADVEAGRLESSTMPLATSLAIARSMDEIRHQIGLTYEADLK